MRPFAGAATSLCVDSASVSDFFFEILAFGAAGLRGAVVLAAAGLRATVLLLVFVAIVVFLKFHSWLKRLNQSHITARPLVDGPPRESRAL